jgi:hypothetical protein
MKTHALPPPPAQLPTAAAAAAARAARSGRPNAPSTVTTTDSPRHVAPQARVTLLECADVGEYTSNATSRSPSVTLLAALQSLLSPWSSPQNRGASERAAKKAPARPATRGTGARCRLIKPGAGRLCACCALHTRGAMDVVCRFDVLLTRRARRDTSACAAGGRQSEAGTKSARGCNKMWGAAAVSCGMWVVDAGGLTETWVER